MILSFPLAKKEKQLVDQLLVIMVMRSRHLIVLALLVCCNIVSCNINRYSDYNGNNAVSNNGQRRQPIQQSYGYGSKSNTIPSNNDNKQGRNSQDQKLSSFKSQMKQIQEQLGIKMKAPNFGGVKHSSNRPTSTVQVKGAKLTNNFVTANGQEKQPSKQNYGFASTSKGMKGIHGQREMDENIGSLNTGENQQYDYDLTKETVVSKPVEPFSNAFGSVREPVSTQEINEQNFEINESDKPPTYNTNYQPKNNLVKQEMNGKLAIATNNDIYNKNSNDPNFKQSGATASGINSLPGQNEEEEKIGTSFEPMISTLVGIR